MERAGASYPAWVINSTNDNAVSAIVDGKGYWMEQKARISFNHYFGLEILRGFSSDHTGVEVIGGA